MTRYFLLIILFLFGTAAFPQSPELPTGSQILDVRVTFRIIEHSVPESLSVRVTGGHENLGSWKPAGVSLEEMNDSLWEISLMLPKDIPVEYKFTLGTWEMEMSDSADHAYSNFKIAPSRDTVVTYVAAGWHPLKQRVPHGQITGTVIYHENFGGSEIIPRTVLVWLPPGYDSDPDKRYPVLYMHDGQNIFDPETSTFGYDWTVDETADSLIRSNSIEEIIVVGIYCSQNRMHEYVPGNEGDQYMKYVVETVKPFIDTNYRTKPDRENTTTAGSSAGGTIAFMLLWNYPEVFSKAACFSPAFKIDRIDVVTPVQSDSQENRDFKLYIDNGGRGIDAELQPGVLLMIDALRKNYKEGESFVFTYYPQDDHNEQAWAARIDDALLFLFGKK